MPEMSKYNLACVYRFHLKATDGEEIMCYLTTKPDGANRATHAASSFGRGHSW